MAPRSATQPRRNLQRRDSQEPTNARSFRGFRSRARTATIKSRSLGLAGNVPGSGLGGVRRLATPWSGGGVVRGEDHEAAGGIVASFAAGSRIAGYRLEQGIGQGGGGGGV